MKPLKNLIERVIPPKPKTHGSERGEIFDEILSLINRPRIKDGYKPIEHARLGYLLKGIETPDLYALLSKMRDADRRGVSPGAAFWLEIRPPKNGV